MTDKKNQIFIDELEKKGFNGIEWTKFFKEKAGINNYQGLKILDESFLVKIDELTNDNKIYYQ